MKVFVFVFVFVLPFLLLATPLFAGNNAERIVQLQAEAQELQARSAEYQQVLSNIQIRLIQIEAIQRELVAQDEAELVIEVADDVEVVE